MAIALALAGGAGIAWVQKRRADNEAAAARAVSEFLRNDLLAQAGASAQIGSGGRPDPDLKVRTALDRAAARVGGKFAGQPLIEASIRRTLGTSYWSLSLYAEAQRQTEKAVELYRRVLGADHPDTIGASEELAEIYRVQGKYSQAGTLLTALLETQHRLGRDQAPETFAIVHELASSIVDGHGDYAHAELLYTKNLEGQRRVVGETNPVTLATMNNLAALLVREGKYPQAEDLYNKLIEAKRRVLGAEHPSTLTSMNGLGVLYRNQGKYAEAEGILKTTLEARRRVMGAQHRDTLSSGNALGLLYVVEGKLDEAESLLTSVVEADRRVLGEKNPDTLISVNSLAELYRRQNKLTQAESLLQSLLAAHRGPSGADTPLARGDLVSLARVKLQQGANAQAAIFSRQALDSYQKSNSDSWATYYVECLLGASLAGLGKHSEAEPLLTSGYQNLIKRQTTIPFDYRSILDEAKLWMENESKRVRQPSNAIR
jgi:tetratricopeptide (TPR) repeat protein